MIKIIEITAERLLEYSSVSIAFQVNEILTVKPVDSGLGGFAFSPQLVPPYIKEYDAFGSPLEWPSTFDISQWGIFLAYSESNLNPIGGAAVAWNTNGVNMLEGRLDLAVLWDLRVQPEFRRGGVGKALFHWAADWARAKGCTKLKVETQNINVPACHFYASQGCMLGDVRRFAYEDTPLVADEVQLNWYLNL